MGFAFDGLDHIQLAAPAGCETEARKFFGGLLGWEEIPKPDKLKSRGGVWFRCGEHEVHIGVHRISFPRSRRIRPSACGTWRSFART